MAERVIRIVFRTVGPSSRDDPGSDLLRHLPPGPESMKRILLQFPPRFSLAPRGLGRFVNPKSYPAVYSWIGGTDMGSDSIATTACRRFIRVNHLGQALRV